MTNPGLTWPPIHAAAMQLLGEQAAARQVFDEHMTRHAGFEARHIAQRVPGDNTRVVQARERPVVSLRRIGMP